MMYMCTVSAVRKLSLFLSIFRFNVQILEIKDTGGPMPVGLGFLFGESSSVLLRPAGAPTPNLSRASCRVQAWRAAVLVVMKKCESHRVGIVGAFERSGGTCALLYAALPVCVATPYELVLYERVWFQDVLTRVVFDPIVH